MSRHGKLFSGGDPLVRGRHKAPYEINDRRVTLAVYRRHWLIAFGNSREGAHAMPRSSSARSRKRAVDRRIRRVGCEHDFEYHEDTVGDYIYSRTDRWLECRGCGEHRAASYEDAPTYDDY